MFKALVGKGKKNQIGPPTYHWKGFEVQMPKVPFHCSCKPDMHELRSKEKAGIKLKI
jgi:hypothetical protein